VDVREKLYFAIKYKTMNKKRMKLIRFDWAMKNLLRDKANFDVLEGFLSVLLGEKIRVETI